MLVSTDGTVKLADFGASKKAGAAFQLTQDEAQAKGIAKGTPLWMAPEVSSQSPRF